MTDSQKTQKNKLPLIISSLFVVLVLVSTWFLFSVLIDSKPTNKKKVVQEVTIIRPPPPPPPEEEPLPEDIQEQDIIEEQMVEEIPDDNAEPPPGDLGLDAEAVVGGDNFGLLGRKGGRGLFGGGSSYGNVVRYELEQFLNNQESLRRSDYRFKLALWIETDGTIKRIEFLGGSGDKKIRNRIKKAIKKLAKFSELRPIEQPEKMIIALESSFLEKL